MSASPTPDPSQQPSQLPPLTGGGIEGVLSSMFTGAHQSAAQQQADFEANRQKDIDMYQQELVKPPVPGEDVNAAAARRLKIADTIAKLRNLNKGQNPISNLAAQLNAIHQHVATPVTPPTQGGQPSPLPGGDVLNAQTAPDPNAATAPAPDAASVHPSVTPAAALPPLSTGQKIKNVLEKAGVGLAHGAGAVLGAASPILMGSTPPTLPTIDPTLIRQAIPPALKFDTSNAVEGNSFGPDDVDRLGQPIDANKKYYLAPDVYGKITTPDGRHFTAEPVEAVAKTVNMRPVYATQGGIDLANAAQLEASGHPFHTPSGEVIKVADIPAGMKLYPMTIGGQSGFGLASERQVKEQAGNMNYVTGEFDLNNPSTYTAVGPTRVPTLHTAPGVTTNLATGEQGIGTVTTGTTPITTGASGAPKPTGLPTLSPGAQIAGGPNAPATGTVQPPATAGAGQPAPAKALPKLKTSSTPSAASPRASGAGSGTVAVPFSAANQMNQRLVPVQEAATALLGDPSTGLTSLDSFAHIAADPKSMNKVGAAVKTAVDQMADQVRSQPGMWQTLSNSSGFTAAKQEIANSVLSDQLKNMNYDERKAFDSLLTSYSTAIGLRSLTRASAAQFSAQAIENEIPIPGYNSVSAPQFYDQLARLTQQIYNGSRTVPNMSEPMRQRIQDGVKQFVELSKEGAPAAKGAKPFTPPPRTPGVDGYYDPVQKKVVYH